jgi:hypothetical protein
MTRLVTIEQNQQLLKIRLKRSQFIIDSPIVCNPDLFEAIELDWRSHLL